MANQSPAAPADLTRLALQEVAGSRRPPPSLSPPPTTPLILPTPRSEPASIQHVGSISTAHRARSRRLSSHCHQQDSHGTTPGIPPFSSTAYTSACDLPGNPIPLRCLNASIDALADELDDIARCVNFCRGSCHHPEEQRSAHWRHRFRYRNHRLVLASVWPQCRCHDTRRRGVSLLRHEI